MNCRERDAGKMVPTEGFPEFRMVGSTAKLSKRVVPALEAALWAGAHLRFLEAVVGAPEAVNPLKLVASLDPFKSGFWVFLGSSRKGLAKIDRGFEGFWVSPPRCLICAQKTPSNHAAQKP